MWRDSGSSAFSLVCSLISQVSVTCEANVSFKDKMLTAYSTHNKDRGTCIVLDSFSLPVS